MVEEFSEIINILLICSFFVILIYGLRLYFLKKTKKALQEEKDSLIKLKKLKSE